MPVIVTILLTLNIVKLTISLCDALSSVKVSFNRAINKLEILVHMSLTAFFHYLAPFYILEEGFTLPGSAALAGSYKLCMYTTNNSS